MKFKVNKIVTRFLLAGDKFMTDLHLIQPGFTYIACGPFTKHRKKTQKPRKTGYLKHLNRKDLAKRPISEKVSKVKAYEIARNPKNDRYQNALASVLDKFFDKKTRSGARVNEDLAEELHKLVIKK